MTGTQTLAPTDPAVLAAAFRAKSETLPRQAAVAAELSKLLSAWDNGTKDREQLRSIGIDYRSTLKLELDGHLGLMDPVDDVQTVVQVAKIVADLAPLVGGATQGPFGVVEGWAGAKVLEAFTDAYGDAMGIPGVQNTISDWRMRNGADASATLSDIWGETFQDVVAQVISVANADPSGEMLRALRDLYPEVFVSPTATQITSGGVVMDHPELFENIFNVTVKADMSVVINDIDAARNQIVQIITGVGADLRTGLSAAAVQMQANQDLNQQIAGGVAGIAIFLKQQAASQAQKDAAESARKKTADTLNAVWGAAQGTVATAAAIAALFGDKKLAKDITRFGSTVISLAKSVVAFAEATAALTKGITAITSLGAAAATGNIIAAISGLIALFTPEEPSPEEQILKELGKIEQQLSDMSNQIADGFNRIDERLTFIYKNVMSCLHDITITVNLTYQMSLTINNRLIEQGRQLSQLSLEMGQWFKTAERMPLKQDISTALDWAVSNEAPLDAANFGLFSGHFYFWAVTGSFDDINQPLTGRGLDLTSAAHELSTGDLADNVSYINRYLDQRGYPHLAADAAAGAQAQLPNLQMWALAAGGFGQLRGEWPTLANLKDVRVKTIRDVGILYRDSVQGLAKDRTLLPLLVKDYLQSLQALGTAMSDYRPTFQREILPGLHGHDIRDPQLTGVVDLGGSEEQNFSYAVAMTAHNSGAADLRCPDNFFQFIPPLLLLAHWLDPVAQRLKAAWTAETSQKITHTYDKNTGEMVEHVVNKMLVTLSATWNDVPFASLRVDTVDTTPEGQDEGSHLASIWDKPGSYLDKFTVQVTRLPPATNAALPAEVHQSGTAAAQSGLATARHELAAQLVTECETGQLRYLARSVDGARSVIENTVRLLLPLPRGGDDMLRALLDGASSAHGGIRVPEVPTIESALLGLPDDAAVFADVGSWLTSFVGESPTLLVGRVNSWQDLVDAGQFDNRQPVVDDVLERLDLATIVVRWTQVLEAANIQPVPA